MRAIPVEVILVICTKHINFISNENTYEQNGGVVMGSILGSFLADRFMID